MDFDAINRILKSTLSNDKSEIKQAEEAIKTVFVFLFISILFLVETA
jgi:hypothetical protein